MSPVARQPSTVGEGSIGDGASALTSVGTTKPIRLGERISVRANVVACASPDPAVPVRFGAGIEDGVSRMACASRGPEAPVRLPTRRHHFGDQRHQRVYQIFMLGHQ
jgi:hypothetical protein